MADQSPLDPQAEESVSAPKAVFLFIWDLVKILVISLVIIIPFRMYVAEPFVVSGTSMVPTYQNKDYLIIDRLSYRRAAPTRGDVIVFRFPLDTSQFFIKRIIGLPGEKVQFKDGRVFVYNQQHPQGVMLNETYLPKQGDTYAATSEPMLVGQDQFFVLGDNRTGSSDSRVWGLLPKSDIIGRVWLRIVPLNNFGLIRTPQYSF